jgi:hypothetical protein
MEKIFKILTILFGILCVGGFAASIKESFAGNMAGGFIQFMFVIPCFILGVLSFFLWKMEQKGPLNSVGSVIRIIRTVVMIVFSVGFTGYVFGLGYLYLTH